MALMELTVKYFCSEFPLDSFHKKWQFLTEKLVDPEDLLSQKKFPMKDKKQLTNRMWS